jgi:hypothetical protein
MNDLPSSTLLPSRKKSISRSLILSFKLSLDKTQYLKSSLVTERYPLEKIPKINEVSALILAKVLAIVAIR